jgi:hypothetical protein
MQFGNYRMEEFEQNQLVPGKEQSGTEQSAQASRDYSPAKRENQSKDGRIPIPPHSTEGGAARRWEEGPAEDQSAAGERRRCSARWGESV